MRIRCVAQKLGEWIQLFNAGSLEEDLSEVQRICDAAAKYAPDYDVEKILQEFMAGA